MNEPSLTSNEAMTRAEKLTAKGERDQAIRLYQQVLKADPGNKKAKKALRNLQQERGVHRLQAEDFDRVMSLMQDGKLDAARGEIQRLCRLHPKQPALHNLRGVVLSRVGKKEEALEGFTLALALEADFADALSNLASTLSDLGRYTEALKCYQQLVKGNQADADVYMNLGRTLHAAGQPDSAEEALRRAVSLKPLSPLANVQLAELLNDVGKSKEAIETYEKTVEIAPRNLRALMGLAKSYSQQRRYQPALEAFRRVHELDPKAIDPVKGIAHALYSLGQTTAAIERFQDVLAIDPSDAVAQHLLASLLGQRKRTGSPDYARSVFDSYAVRYEEHLMKTLEAQFPLLVPEVLEELDGQDAWYAQALDLGCGTGIMGTQLRSYCEHLTGVDVAPSMIAKAEEKAVYNELVTVDIEKMLRSTSASYDLVICADVLIYIGALESLFALVAEHINPGARFIFSTELLHEGDDLALRPTGRFAHSDDYVVRCAVGAGLEVTVNRQINLRKEKDEWLVGGMYVLTPSGPSATPQ